MLVMLVLLILFIFQPQAGIRIHCVTGVQTCALPIYPRSGELRVHPIEDGLERDDLAGLAGRSEERRVGKECRARGAPYHEKRKQHQTPQLQTLFMMTVSRR